VRTPASIPAAAVVAGAALGTWIGAEPVLPGVVLLAVALAASALTFIARRPVSFTIAVAVVFASGACALAQRAESQAADPEFRRQLSDVVGRTPVWLEGRLRNDAAPGDNGVGLTLDVERWEHAGTVREVAPSCRPSGVRVSVAGAMAMDRLGEWRDGRGIRLPAFLRVPGRYQDPGVADGRLALARRGVALVGSVKSGALVEVRAPGSWGAEVAAGIRALTRRAVHRHVGRFDSQSEAIVVAILIGDRVGVDDEVQRRLQEAGTYHVMAISGGNIAIVAGVLLWLLRVAGAGHRAAGWVTMAALAGYAVVVGGGASVTRATLMAIIYLLARQAGHRGAPLNALAVSAALLLLGSPSSVADVGFWLTFGATLGIVLGIELAGSRLPRRGWLRLPAALMLTSGCAELALFPVSAFVFARVTFAGLALNFIAIPMMGVAEIAGIVSVLLSAVWAGAADAAGFAAHLGATGLVGSAGLVGLAPWSTYRLPPPAVLAVAAYYAGWAAWLATGRVGGAPGAAKVGGRPGRRVRAAALGVVIVSGAWILVEPVTLFAPGVRGRLRVTVADVGHGDAVLVQLPDRRSLLVDAGGSMSPAGFDVGGRVVAPTLWALGTRRLDVLVLSHADPDHAGGAASLVRDFRPREIWEGTPVPPLPVLRRLKAQAAAAGIRWREQHSGDRMRFGEVTLAVLHPPPPDWERQRVRNDDSLVIEVRWGETSFVLAGDIGRDVERDVAPAFDAAGIRVLKVPHHGSATSSSAGFVSVLRPRVAILSAGATTKVSDEVLRRYEEIGATLYRTDRDGAVTLETDGHRVTVTTFTGTTGVFTRQ
jgi:competence protein ComEC